MTCDLTGQYAPSPVVVERIPGKPRYVGDARAFVHDLGFDAQVLVSELCTNAILHTASGQPGGTVLLVMQYFESEARVTVSDDGPPGAAVPWTRNGHASNGYGLSSMMQLAREWGIRVSARGSDVWFVVPVQSDLPMPAGSSRARAPGARKGHHQRREPGKQPVPVAAPNCASAPCLKTADCPLQTARDYWGL